MFPYELRSAFSFKTKLYSDKSTKVNIHSTNHSAEKHLSVLSIYTYVLEAAAVSKEVKMIEF